MSVYPSVTSQCCLTFFGRIELVFGMKDMGLDLSGNGVSQGNLSKHGSHAGLSGTAVTTCCHLSSTKTDASYYKLNHRLSTKLTMLGTVNHHSLSHCSSSHGFICNSCCLSLVNIVWRMWDRVITQQSVMTVFHFLVTEPVDNDWLFISWVLQSL